MREIILATMGEMALKGQNRKAFESALMRTLRRRTAGCGEWTVQALQSVLYLRPRNEEARAALPAVFERCEKVFGIAALTRAVVCNKDFEAICATVTQVADDALRAAQTFKVAARRADKRFPMNSMDIARELGGFLLGQYPHLRVDVKQPQAVVTVEVREDAAYIHAGKKRGAGGLPIPTSGRAALLLSGGIDSPVAAWLMAKRGLSLVPVHFASPPYTSVRAAAKVRALAGMLAEWCGPLPYYYVPYTEAQEYLRDKLPRQDYFTVLMRRSMLRIAGILAEKEQCEAMITGESLAQVASQTLQALGCTNTVQALPVLRPCIGMDKLEITDIARKIGTYETSILPFEDCCTIFTPPHPKTKPRMAEVEALEARLPDLPHHEQKAAENAQFELIMPE